MCALTTCPPPHMAPVSAKTIMEAIIADALLEAIRSRIGNFPSLQNEVPVSRS